MHGLKARRQRTARVGRQAVVAELLAKKGVETSPIGAAVPRPPQPLLPAGLTTEEAARLLEQYGPNDPIVRKRRTLPVEVLSLFSNPLVVILLVASGVAAALGEIVNATIIAVIVLLSAAINFFQTYRSRRAIERLGNGWTCRGGSSCRAT
jgi:hypothetical protein